MLNLLAVAALTNLDESAAESSELGMLGSDACNQIGLNQQSAINGSFHYFLRTDSPWQSHTSAFANAWPS